MVGLQLEVAQRIIKAVQVPEATEMPAASLEQGQRRGASAKRWATSRKKRSSPAHRSPMHPSIPSFNFFHRFIASLTQRLMDSWPHRFIGWLAHWFTKSVPHWFIDSFCIESWTRSVTQSLSHWFIDSLAHMCIDSLTHWITDSPIHWTFASLTHWVFDSLIYWFTDSLVHCLVLQCFSNSVILWFSGSVVHRLISRWYNSQLQALMLLHLKHVPIGHRFLTVTSYFRNFRPGACRALSSICQSMQSYWCMIYPSTSTYRIYLNLISSYLIESNVL